MRCTIHGGPPRATEYAHGPSAFLLEMRSRISRGNHRTAVYHFSFSTLSEPEVAEFDGVHFENPRFHRIT
jgi:hypothetical protein